MPMNCRTPGFYEVYDTYQQMADAVDPREGPDQHSEIELKLSADCLHEHSYTTMCGVTRCLICDQVVG